VPRSNREPEPSPPAALRFAVALEPALLLRARERLRDYLRLHCTDGELVDDVVLCLEEAATNVIRHSGSAEEMRIELRFEGDQLTCLVSDRGRGFDIDAFDPEAVPDPLRSGGRGLYIIGQLMDDVSLRMDGGLEVHMLKRGVQRCETGPLESLLGDLRGAGDSDYQDTRRRAMLEEIDEGFAALDWEYRYVHVNAMLQRMGGLSREEMLGRTPWELFPYFSGSASERQYRGAMELGRPSLAEWRSPVNGDWYETRVYPTPGGICLYARLINERKRQEEERALLAAEVERRNRVLAGAKKTLGAALSSASEEDLGRICLSVAEDLTGSKFGFIGEVASDGLYDIAVSDPGWDACAMADQSGHRGAPGEFELHGLYGEILTSGKSLLANAPSDHPASAGTPPGHPPLSAFLGVPLRTHDRTTGIIAVGNREGGYRDEDRLSLEELASSVAEAFARKRSEQALREHEARLRALFETMHEAFFLYEPVSDEDGRVVDVRYLDCNPAGERFVSRTRVELIGRTSAEVMGGSPTTSSMDAFRRVAMTGEPTQFTEFSVRLGRRYTASMFSPWPGQVAMILRDITQGKQAEESLREGEERFRLLHDTMLQGVVYQDADGTIISMNPAAEKILGKRPEDFVGSSSVGEEHDTLRDDGSPFPGFEHPAMVALRTGGPVPDVLMQVYNPRESQYRLISIQAVPLFRPGEDKPHSVYTVFEDVTERRRAEEALRRSEGRLRRFYEAGLVGIIYWNTDGEIVDANDRFLEMTGYTRDELESGEIDWVNMTPPEFRHVDVRSLEELKATGVNAVPFEKEYSRRDGTRLPVILAGAMLDEERRDGVGFVLDMSEHKRLEQALHDAEARAKDLIRYAPTAIYEIGFDRPCFKSVNDAMCSLTGFEREELLAMNPFDLLDAESQRVFQERIAAGLAGESIPDYVEYRARTKDGCLLDVILNVSFTYTDGTIDGALVVGWDVTERKQAEKALRESDERFSSLFESMTEGVALHELVYDDDGCAVDYRLLHVNASFERETGIKAELARGRFASDLYGAGEAPYLREFANVAEGGEPWSFETYFAPIERHFRIIAVSSERGRFATIFENITESKRAEAEIQDKLATTRALLEAATGTATLDLDAALGRLVDIVAERLGRSRVVIHLFEGEREVRTAAARDLRVLRTGEIQRLDDYSVELQEATMARKPVVVDLTRENLSAMAARERARLQIEIVLYVPLMVKERLIGIVTIDEPLTYRPFSDRDVELASALAAQAATAIENARLFEAEQAAQRRAEAELARSRLLQQAAVAASTSVSVEEVTDRVLQAIFEGMDLKVGTVYSYDRDRELLELLAWHGMDEARDKFQTVAVVEDSPALVVRAALTKSVVTTSDVPLGEEGRRALEAAGVNRAEAVALPIEYGGAVVGCCSFIFERDRAFDREELELFRSLTLILGQAIENARLYEDQKAIAVTLQEHFIRPLPDVPGVEIGMVSQAAYAPELVGGDFSDVFELTDGRVAVLIGDVAGKGVKAAGLTETARSMVRAFAAVEPSPALVLGRTNEALLRDDPAANHITAFLAVLDPQTGHTLYASAGHPAAVHLSPVSCRPLEVTYGPPLHGFPTVYANEHVRLSLDDYLLLYTDGVTEARRDGEQFGEQRLCELAARLWGGSAQEIAESVRDAAREFAGQLRDDLHVVCLRLA
jgi:PAS domain S-box-containing protein